MSTLGKIFAFIVLVAAVAFASAAGVLTQEQTNWKDAHDQLDKDKSAEITKLTEERNTLQADRTKALQDAEKWRKEVDDYKTALLNANTAITKLQGDLALVEKDRNRLTDEVALIKNKLTVQMKDIARLDGEKDAANLAKEAAEKAMRQAEDDLANARDTINNLRNQLKLTTGDLKSAINLNQRWEDTFGAEGRRLAGEAETPLPKINGQVVKADNRAGIIMISVGKGDGVTQGMNFIVVRKGYVGKIRVTNVYDEDAICRVILAQTPDPIKEGDYVTTRLE